METAEASISQEHIVLTKKYFSKKKKKWNPKYFGVYVICDCLKPKQYEPYYSISNYHSDLFCGRYLLLHQARPLNPTFMFNYKLHLILIGFYV